ncbi:uncharacterized protein C2845_PM03G18420 [Panicum miliaceum]|uniref:Plastocyanin-like domain-containing protein n=1 Tax=Panicum miliaceum TaxID=4540 RepID=A0A3L6TA05_PANMI|nr:uncharacterized protein C2845_PM03G18420 [Panicum miliaceum]
MEGKSDEGSRVGEPSSVAAGGELDLTAATTGGSLPSIEWGKAACSEESIQKWTAPDVFRPGELLEWRAPAKDEVPSPPTMEEEDRFVILSLTHIMCGLRTDASDFLVSVLGHYGIEWLYRNNKGETTTLGAVYFRLRDNMKRNYPVYYLKASQFVWTSLWFYAKIPQSCRLTFRGDALKETNNWKDVLHLSPEQEKRVLKIGELSSKGLTGVDIVYDFLKHQISPLRRRAHLACNYTGPTDPTRDSDKDHSEEDIESKLSYLLDLRKTGQKEPPRKPNVPSSLIRASANERANQHLDLLRILSTFKVKKKAVEELTAPRTIGESSSYKPLVPASPRRYTRQSAVPRNIVVGSPPEIDSSPFRDHSDLENEKILEAKTTMTTASSPNQGVQQKSIEKPAEIEREKRVALVEPISSIIGCKRKVSASPSGSRRKAKYSFISIMAKTRMSSLNTGRIKGTTLRKEAAVALHPQSPRSARRSSASSVEKGDKSVLFILANVVDQNKVAEDSVSNVFLGQHVRDSSPKEVAPAQSIAERVQRQKAIEESALIPVPNSEEINNEAIWEGMQKLQREHVSLSKKTLSELLEQAKKLVIMNKRLKDEHIMLEQQVKENKRLLTNTTRKAEKEVLKRIEENTKLKNEIGDQKKMIDELSEQNESIQGSLVQKCREVNRLKEEVAVLIKDKEELQSRVLQADEILDLMRSALRNGKDFYSFTGQSVSAHCSFFFPCSSLMLRNMYRVYPNGWSAILVSLDNQGMWNLRSVIWDRQYLGQQLYLRVWTQQQSFSNEYSIPTNAILCGRAPGLPH